MQKKKKLFAVVRISQNVVTSEENPHFAIRMRILLLSVSQEHTHTRSPLRGNTTSLQLLSPGGQRGAVGPEQTHSSCDRQEHTHLGCACDRCLSTRTTLLPEVLLMLLTIQTFSLLLFKSHPASLS